MPKISYREESFSFPFDALGGTRDTPKIKPADELLLNWAYEQYEGQPLPALAVYHDRDGVLSTCLYGVDRVFVSDNVGHNTAALQHLLEVEHEGRKLPTIASPMLPLAAERELVLMQVPKSLDLFELYLASATFTAGPGRRIAAAFQTRHFSPKMVEIAEKYAGTVNQSRAYKKARLLILADLKPGKIPEELYRQVAYRETNYYQYYGVFSAKHIDYATQYLLDEFKTNHLLAGISNVAAILDIGSGNGVILDQLGGQFAGSRLLATEVSAAAVASTSQNVLKAEVHLSANLSSIADGTVDLIVTNPPFHDGHKNAIEPTIELFKEAKTKLTERGHFVVVANRHLNYVTHLDRLFEEVIEVADNGKFMVYRCSVD